jgi:cell division protein FtsW
VFLHPEQADPDKSFQANQSKIAIATGGIIGKGPGNSTQRNYLPHPYSDFVYALIIEEYGLVGGVALAIIYLVFLYRCILIVTASPKAFGALLAAGLSFSLTIQAFANMAVAVGLGPVTGVPLPLVSMGGTSMLFTSIAFGIILSVSRDVEEKKNGISGKDDKVIVGEIPAMG